MNNSIILYHQETCGQCATAMMLLKRANVDFVSCKDTKVMKEKGVTKTPTLEADGQFIEGAKAINEWIRNRK